MRVQRHALQSLKFVWGPTGPKKGPISVFTFLSGEPARLRAPDCLDVGSSHGVSWQKFLRSCEHVQASQTCRRESVRMITHVCVEPRRLVRHTSVVRGLISRDAKAQSVRIFAASETARFV